MPRELSRSHHLLHVALAYNLTKREEFADFLITQIINWIDENPLMYSINWGCAMDVSIRAVNWIWCLGLLSDYDWGKYDKELSQIEESLFQHGWFIFRNLEGSIFNYTNNHYISNLSGLIFLGQLFNSTRDGKKWLDYGRSSFYREIRIQIIIVYLQQECLIITNQKICFKGTNSCGWERQGWRSKNFRYYRGIKYCS